MIVMMVLHINYADMPARMLHQSMEDDVLAKVFYVPMDRG